jgi:thioredoxin reductase (NADPH)
MSDTQHTHVAIIGSGAAGLTAAIYAARANLKPVVVSGIQPGGQLTITTDVENFPGFEDGIMGPDLMDVMRKQAERFGTEFVEAEVTEVDMHSTPKRLTMDDGTIVTADSLIVATGATARLLGLKAESHLMGYGVSACATCDGFFFRDKPIVVIGGGDSAMEEATFLTKFASEVTVIHRSESLRASKIMIERAEKNPKVKFVWNKRVTDVLGDRDSGVTGLALEDTVTGEASTFATEGLFLAIGHVPNTKIFTEKLDMDPEGYLLTIPGGTKTNIDGVFAVGDVTDRTYRQAVTAAGSGCMGALDAERWLTDNGIEA